jgi:hypothetical protein
MTIFSCLQIVVSNACCCCLRLVCRNVAGFSGLSILCCPFALSNMFLPRSLLEWTVALFYCLYVRDYVWAFIASVWNISKIIWRQKAIYINIVQYLNDGLCMSEGNDLCKEQYFNVSWAHKTKTTTPRVRHYYSQTITNNINKTSALPQTTEGKDELHM